LEQRATTTEATTATARRLSADEAEDFLCKRILAQRTATASWLCALASAARNRALGRPLCKHATCGSLRATATSAAATAATAATTAALAQVAQQRDGTINFLFGFARFDHRVDHNR
jgi:hypothetical protein